MPLANALGLPFYPYRGGFGTLNPRVDYLSQWVNWTCPTYNSSTVFWESKDKTPNGYNLKLTNSNVLSFNGTTDKITFSDLTGITITDQEGTGTASISGNDVNVTAGTLSYLEFSNGSFYRLASNDPNIVYDKSGNGLHGTLTGGTWATDNGRPDNLIDGFSQKLVNTVAGTSYIESTQAYGVWEFEISQDKDVNSSMVLLMNSATTIGDGYIISFTNTSNRLQLLRFTGGVVSAGLFFTAASYIDSNILYGIKVVRNSIVDEYITGSVGTFAVYIKGGLFGSDYILVDTTGGSGTNPVTDNTHTTSNYLLLDLDEGDQIKNLKYNDICCNIFNFTDDTGTYSQVRVPALSDSITEDTEGSELSNPPCSVCKGHNGAETTMTQYETQELIDADARLTTPLWFTGGTANDVSYDDLVANVDGEWIVMTDVDSLPCKKNTLLINRDLTTIEKVQVGLFTNAVERLAVTDGFLQTENGATYVLKSTYTT